MIFKYMLIKLNWSQQSVENDKDAQARQILRKA